MVWDNDFVYWINKSLKTQIKIWKILNLMIIDKEYFKTHWINEISKDFNICKKTLKKYLRSNFVKLKWIKEKRIYFREKTEYLFFKELQRVVNKYNWFIDNWTIKKGQYYLNNMRI